MSNAIVRCPTCNIPLFRSATTSCVPVCAVREQKAKRLEERVRWKASRSKKRDFKVTAHVIQPLLIFMPYVCCSLGTQLNDIYPRPLVIWSAFKLNECSARPNSNTRRITIPSTERRYCRRRAKSRAKSLKCMQRMKRKEDQKLLNAWNQVKCVSYPLA